MFRSVLYSFSSSNFIASNLIYLLLNDSFRLIDDEDEDEEKKKSFRIETQKIWTNRVEVSELYVCECIHTR